MKKPPKKRLRAMSSSGLLDAVDNVMKNVRTVAVEFMLMGEFE